MKREVMPACNQTLEHIAILAAAAALGAWATGCTAERDLLEVTTSPEHVAQLEEAVALWNEALPCPAIRLAPDGLPVRFYTATD